MSRREASQSPDRLKVSKASDNPNPPFNVLKPFNEYDHWRSHHSHAMYGFNSGTLGNPSNGDYMRGFYPPNIGSQSAPFYGNGWPGFYPHPPPPPLHQLSAPSPSSAHFGPAPPPPPPHQIDMNAFGGSNFFGYFPPGSGGDYSAWASNNPALLPPPHPLLATSFSSSAIKENGVHRIDENNNNASIGIGAGDSTFSDCTINNDQTSDYTANKTTDFYYDNVITNNHGHLHDGYLDYSPKHTQPLVAASSSGTVVYDHKQLEQVFTRMNVCDEQVLRQPAHFHRIGAHQAPTTVSGFSHHQHTQHQHVPPIVQPQPPQPRSVHSMMGAVGLTVYHQSQHPATQQGATAKNDHQIVTTNGARNMQSSVAISSSSSVQYPPLSNSSVSGTKNGYSSSAAKKTWASIVKQPAEKSQAPQSLGPVTKAAKRVPPPVGTQQQQSSSINLPGTDKNTPTLNTSTAVINGSTASGLAPGTEMTNRFPMEDDTTISNVIGGGASMNISNAAFSNFSGWPNQYGGAPPFSGRSSHSGDLFDPAVLWSVPGAISGSNLTEKSFVDSKHTTSSSVDPYYRHGTDYSHSSYCNGQPKRQAPPNFLLPHNSTHASSQSQRSIANGSLTPPPITNDQSRNLNAASNTSSGGGPKKYSLAASGFQKSNGGVSAAANANNIPKSILPRGCLLNDVSIDHNSANESKFDVKKVHADKDSTGWTFRPTGASSILDKLKRENDYNPKEFGLLAKNARYFVIKSYNEDDFHRSIKYGIWCSTEHGNKRLDQTFREREGKGPVYLFPSVNGSGHFCGVAQMTSPVDYGCSTAVWAQDKYKGQFTVKWIYVKDVPNAQLRHIRLENNENKPVTNSRDTQEVPGDKGLQVLKIIHAYPHTTSLFDDFTHYEKREREEEERKKRSHTPQQI